MVEALNHMQREKGGTAFRAEGRVNLRPAREEEFAAPVFSRGLDTTSPAAPLNRAYAPVPLMPW